MLLFAQLHKTVTKAVGNIKTEKHSRGKMARFLVRSKNLTYGFSWTGDVNSPQPECVLCREKLANANMVPSKLKRHLETRHPFHVERNLAYFKRARDLNRRQQERLLYCVKVSEKAMEASYMLAALIAKQKKPHTIAETLQFLTACKIIAGVILGPDATNELSKVPLSDNTIKRRIDDMSEDIEQHLTDKLQTSSRLSLQMDESTDISGAAQLLAKTSDMLMVTLSKRLFSFAKKWKAILREKKYSG